MENTVVERTPVQDMTQSEWKLSFPDVESFVLDCVSADTPEYGVHQKLMGIITQANQAISLQNSGEADEYFESLSLIAKGLRHHTAERDGFRFFYFGQFQTHLDMLEQEREQKRSEAQILSVASRKHFPKIMQMLYTCHTCQQKELSHRLGIHKSNLSREMQHLLDSGLVESTQIGRFKYYELTPRGHRYYNTYLIMKSQLEEQIYAPNQDGKTLCGKEFYSRTQRLNSKSKSTLASFDREQKSMEESIYQTFSYLGHGQTSVDEPLCHAFTSLDYGQTFVDKLSHPASDPLCRGQKAEDKPSILIFASYDHNENFTVIEEKPRMKYSTQLFKEGQTDGNE